MAEVEIETLEGDFDEEEIVEAELVHPLKGRNAQAKQFYVLLAVAECETFLLAIADETCRRPKGTNGKKLKCNCLAFLKDDDCAAELKGAAKFMVQFARMHHDEQKDQLRD